MKKKIFGFSLGAIVVGFIIGAIVGKKVKAVGDLVDKIPMGK